MSSSLEIQSLIFFGILIVAFALLVTEQIRIDLVALFIILALAITRLLTAEEALVGFSSEPAIIVAAIFVLNAALKHTGVSETIGKWIGHLSGHTYEQAIVVMMPLVALLSAFTHHLTTTAFMIPIVLDFSRERDIPASKLLLPLSMAASLGTTITIIGAPAFLIASAVLQRTGRPGLGIFSITPIGVSLTLVGTLFVLLLGRFLLPSRQGNRAMLDRLRVDRYFTELTILPNSALVGKTLEEAKALRHYQFTVSGCIRNGQRLARPFDQHPLEVGDVLLIHTSPEDLVTLHQDQGIALHPLDKFKEHLPDTVAKEDFASQLVQAIVAPRSEMIGQSLRAVDFRRRYGALVVAFWRRGSFSQQELARIRLRAGDVLVLQGDEDALSRVSRDPAFLMFVPFQGEPRVRRRAPIATLIILATVSVAVLNILSLQLVMLAGAVAMVLTGCLTPAQAYRSIDVRIYVFIAGAIPLGTAMQKSGASHLITQWLQQAIGSWSTFFILLLIFAVVGILTQFMSDAATTALFAPLAAALALALGDPPEPYVVTVAMSSVTALLTPIGHHGNLLVYGPGGYRFADFLRVGVPLTLLLALVVVTLSLLLWPA
jgi:di/tricarboxylate transporter